MANQNLFKGLDIESPSTHPKLKDLDAGDYKDGGHQYLMPAIVGDAYPANRKSGMVFLWSGHDRAYIYFPSGNWKEITHPENGNFTSLWVGAGGLTVTGETNLQNTWTAQLVADATYVDSLRSYGNLQVDGASTLQSVGATTISASSYIYSSSYIQSVSYIMTPSYVNARYFTSNTIGFFNPIAYSFQGYTSGWGMGMEPPTSANGGSVFIISNNSYPIRFSTPRNDLTLMLRQYYTDCTSCPVFTEYTHGGAWSYVYRQISRHYINNTGQNKKRSFIWYAVDINSTNFPQIQLWHNDENTLSQTHTVSFGSALVTLSVTNGFYLLGLASGSGGWDLQIHSDGSIKYVSSSERYKTDIIDTPVSISYRLLNVSVRDYTRISNNRRETSLIAEELYEHLPQAVGVRDGLPDGFSWSDVNPHILNVVKDLARRVKELEDKLSTL